MPKRAGHTVVKTREEPSLLDELVASPGATRSPAPEALIGECIDARHPTLVGRGLIRWKDGQGVEESRWLPTLSGVVLREGDRVVLTQPTNFDEPIVMGVLDGFVPRPEPDAPRGPSIALERDETLRVTTSEGVALLEIHQEDSGPVVRIVAKGLDLELPGKLRLSADAIEIEARKGPVNVRASDDVIVRGEVIKLN